MAKARANEPRKQRRHDDMCDGAATWPGVVDADEQSWPPKPTAKRKAPIDCIDHAHTHTPGIPIGSPSTVDGQAEVKLSEAARALREVRQLPDLPQLWVMLPVYSHTCSVFNALHVLWP